MFTIDAQIRLPAIWSDFEWWQTVTMTSRTYSCICTLHKWLIHSLVTSHVLSQMMWWRVKNARIFLTWRSAVNRAWSHWQSTEIALFSWNWVFSMIFALCIQPYSIRINYTNFIQIWCSEMCIDIDKFVHSCKFRCAYTSDVQVKFRIDPGKSDVYQCNKDAKDCCATSTRGKLWYTININCGFINFHSRGFWTG